MAETVRILIIEGDLSVREMLRDVLELVGYEVLEASDGDSGVRLYRRAPTDLIIADLFMPRQDGLEAILEVRREFPHAKIIAMSSGNVNGVPDLLAEAHRCGAWRTIGKPFRLHEMLTAVRETVST